MPSNRTCLPRPYVGTGVYYNDLSAKVLGYRPPEILVLHLNSINAATADRMLEVFKDLDHSFMSLAGAQGDAATSDLQLSQRSSGRCGGTGGDVRGGVKVDGSLQKEPPQRVADNAAGKRVSAAVLANSEYPQSVEGGHPVYRSPKG